MMHDNDNKDLSFIKIINDDIWHWWQGDLQGQHCKKQNVTKQSFKA